MRADPGGTPKRRYLRPPWMMGRLVNPVIMALGLSGTIALAVKGRRSGQVRSVPVNVITHDGNRYLVAPRGDTHWARNLRAAGEGELRGRGRTEHFRAIEVVPAEAAPIIAAYRRQIPIAESQFAELPDDADHPVFRVQAS